MLSQRNQTCLNESAVEAYEAKQFTLSPIVFPVFHFHRFVGNHFVRCWLLSDFVTVNILTLGYTRLLHFIDIMMFIYVFLLKFLLSFLFSLVSPGSWFDIFKNSHFCFKICTLLITIHICTLFENWTQICPGNFLCLFLSAIL